MTGERRLLMQDGVETGAYAYTGSFTPTERVFTYDFYAPGCTYLACASVEKPDLTTGKGFVYSFICTVGRYDSSRSMNSGTSVAGEAYATSNPTVTYSSDTFHLTYNSGDIQKIPQPGIEYIWCAW